VTSHCSYEGRLHFIVAAVATQLRPGACICHIQEVERILQHPGAQARVTSLGTSRVLDTLDLTCLSPLRHLTALQLAGFFPCEDSMLAMQQLTSLTRLSVQFLFNPPTLPPTNQPQYCTLPPRLKLLCIENLQLYQIDSWLPALTAVSGWGG
jgi:hypothetical protein